MKKLFHSFVDDIRAVALIEFAIVFPFIFVLLFGAVELGRSVLIHERVEKSAYVLSDITSQYLPASGARASGEINIQALQNTVFPQMNTLMGIYSSAQKQRVIFTAIRREGLQARIKWQVTGGGSLNNGVISVVNGLAVSAIGPNVRDTVANFTADPSAAALIAQMAPGETLLVGEVFYRYEPILTDLLFGVTRAISTNNVFFLSPNTIAKHVYFRTRAGDLICLPPDFLYDECQVMPSTNTGGCTCVYSSSQRVTNCQNRNTLATDYFRCGDNTTRGFPNVVAPSAACAGASYGTAIENFTNTAQNGQCRTP